MSFTFTKSKNLFKNLKNKKDQASIEIESRINNRNNN